MPGLVEREAVVVGRQVDQRRPTGLETFRRRPQTALLRPRALTADPDIYQRGGMLVRVLRDQQPEDGISPQVELAYIVSGTDDDIAAKTSLLAATPIWYDGLIRQSLNIEPLGPGMWDGKVRYGRLEKQPPTGEHTFSFDTRRSCHSVGPS